MRLEGKVAIVTGAAQGIGAAIASDFAKEGGVVYGVDKGAHIEAACASIRQAGGKAFGCRLDITDHQMYAELVTRIAEAHGHIDILVNNAAIAYYEELLNSSLEHWREIQSVNLEAPYIGCKLVAPHMIKSGWGRIVNIASTQAIATEATVGAYAASKGAIVSFTKSLAVELAPYGINANAIAPGCIHTPMSIINGVDETTTEYFQTWYVGKRKIPLARAGRPEEIARAAVFLASDDASYVTGHTLVADGGLTITF
jgi:NAD(P)-dependent dehydrogenase (short-subunit alcohol dehydrogenase family)